METNEDRKTGRRTSRAAFSRLRALLFASLVTAFTLGACAATASAQSPTPAPQPSPAHSFSDNLARMSLEATRILPYYIYEVESPLLDWFIKVAQLLGVAITMTAFLRVLRQHEGGSFDLGWWFARVAVCVALITMTTSIINFGTSMGNAIAFGTGEGDSWLNTVRRAQQESFNDSYAKFQSGTFTVRVKGEDLPVNSNPDPSDPTYGLVGVLYNREAKLADVQSKLDVSSWSMTTLFSFLSICRAIMEFGDFFLIILRSFLLIGTRLFAPFMVAIAIDREFAKQSAYKFAWGVSILTLVFPSVVQLVRILAYGAGNIALALGDKDPLYIWDKATMTAVTDPTVNPVFVILVMGVVMAIAGIAMFFSPVIAYKIAMGEMYQVVSNIVSGVTGGGVATAIGTVSASAAAAANKQAELTQIQGSADAQTETAKARRESGLLSAKGSEVASVAAARGSMVAQLASIEGARVAGVKMASSAAEFGRQSTAAGVSAQQRETTIRRDQTNTMTDASNQRENQQAAGEAKAAKKDKWTGAGGGGAIPVVGAPVTEVFTDGFGDSSITVRNRTARDSSNQYADTAKRAENAATDRMHESQSQYGSDMTGAYNQKEGADIGAVNSQAGIAAGGAVEGTNITVGGITAKHSYDVKSVEAEYAGQMGNGAGNPGAIEIMRQAGEARAEWQRVAQTVNAFGSIAANQASSLFRELRF
jgi:hypothetical protein